MSIFSSVDDVFSWSRDLWCSMSSITTTPCKLLCKVEIYKYHITSIFSSVNDVFSLSRDLWCSMSPIPLQRLVVQYVFYHYNYLQYNLSIFSSVDDVLGLSRDFWCSMSPVSLQFPWGCVKIANVNLWHHLQKHAYRGSNIVDKYCRPWSVH